MSREGLRREVAHEAHFGEGAEAMPVLNWQVRLHPIGHVARKLAGGPGEGVDSGDSRAVRFGDGTVGSRLRHR